LRLRHLQDVAHRGAGAQRRRRRNAEAAGQVVGGLEADAPDVDREAVRVLLDDRDRVLAVALVDPGRVSGGDAVAAEEDHDLLDVLLRHPRGADAARARGADALDLGQPDRRAADDLERPLAEARDDALGQLGADAGHHARAEVLLDAERGGRRPVVEGLDLELLAELLVVDPRAAQDQRRAGLDPEQRADHGDRRAAAVAHHARDGPLVVRVLEHDLLERALDGLVTRHRGGSMACRPDRGVWARRLHRGRGARGRRRIRFVPTRLGCCNRIVKQRSRQPWRFWKAGVTRFAGDPAV
jgi:hypothetical protein